MNAKTNVSFENELNELSELEYVSNLTLDECLAVICDIAFVAHESDKTKIAHLQKFLKKHIDIK